MRKQVLNSIGGCLILLLFSPGVLYARNVSYSIVHQSIYDNPTKTQIQQYIAVSGIPTKAGLKAEIMRRYRAALARRGFQYHNPATNIYIYVYANRKLALHDRSMWLGMIAKSFYDKGIPRVSIDNGRLAALSQPHKIRFGLSESKRKEVFRELAVSDNRATHDAEARVPNSQVMKQIDLERKLDRRYRANVARKYHLSKKEIQKIVVEGVKKGWPTH